METLHDHAIEAASPHTMNTYGRVPIALSHGQGVRVWDVNGKQYLDALGGIAVNTLGHNHPKLVPALQDQVAKIIHSSNYYHVPNQEVLAAKLVELSGLTNVFFCSTGLEANEAALEAGAQVRPRQGHRESPRSWCTRRPSMAAASPPCLPPATRRCRPALARWWKVSSACR
jgi:acetylornithine/succinyldiaminopimelate/putrescine aminotransferase